MMDQIRKELRRQTGHNMDPERAHRCHPVKRTETRSAIAEPYARRFGCLKLSYCCIRGHCG